MNILNNPRHSGFIDIKSSLMLILEERIKNLETVSQQKDLSPENRQILSQEIKRLNKNHTKEIATKEPFIW